MSALFDWRLQDSRLDRLNLRTGLFIAIAFVLLSLVVAGTLLRQGLLAQTASLYFFTDSAQGIAKGMSVQLSGFRIGTVEEITLESDARVKTRVVIKDEYMRHIGQDAEARLAKEGLIGAGFIEIVPGAGQARPMPNNGVLKFERAGDFAKMTEALADKLHPILDDVKKMTEAASDPQGDLRLTLRNVRQATATLGDLEQELMRVTRTVHERTQSLTGDVGKILTRADEAMQKANATLGNLQSTVAAIDRDLPQTLLKLDRTLGNVEAVTADEIGRAHV